MITAVYTKKNDTKNKFPLFFSVYIILGHLYIIIHLAVYVKYLFYDIQSKITYLEHI